MKKTITLNIGRQIKMLTGPALTAKGRPMTIRDLILQRIQIVASPDEDHAGRLWDIGLEIEKVKNTFTMTELDFELLKKLTLVVSEMQNWAWVNLNQAFKDAKRE